MNKSDLIEKIVDKTQLPRKRAEVVVNLVFDAMTEALAKGDRIEIRGFGSFVAKQYRARTGRNPRTGETIPVPAKRLPFFKVGKELKERVDYDSDDEDDDDDSEIGGSPSGEGPSGGGDGGNGRDDGSR